MFDEYHILQVSGIKHDSFPRSSNKFNKIELN